MENPVAKSLTLPALQGALPRQPADLYRLHRLCLHIYGLLTRDLQAQAQALTEAAAHGLRGKYRQEMMLALQEELPVIMALHALDRLGADPRLTGEGLDDLMRGLLLPFFALSYRQLYDEPADPLKHVMARMDWYLDGDKGGPLEALAHYLHTVLGDKLGDTGPLSRYLTEKFLPEMDRRLELAFRYEFS